MQSPQNQVRPLNDWSIIPLYVDRDKLLNFVGTWRLMEPNIRLKQAEFAQCLHYSILYQNPAVFPSNRPETRLGCWTIARSYCFTSTEKKYYAFFGTWRLLESNIRLKQAKSAQCVDYAILYQNPAVFPLQSPQNLVRPLNDWSIILFYVN